MRKRVGVYCRLSEEDREKENINSESESIQNQKNMLLKYAIEHEWEVVDIYCDEDYSGAGMYRPDFDRLIKDCEASKIDIVLCKTQSRFSRDMEVIEKYLHNKFLEWNIRFISILDNADTEVKGNKKSRQINGLVNEWYLEDLSENIKGTIRAKKQRGEYTGSFAPYGYVRDKEDKHHLVVDTIASEVVKTIFELYKNGTGYQKIVKYLNANDIPSPYEYKKMNGSKLVVPNVKGTSHWHTDTIAKILKDEVYIGNLAQGKRKNLSYKIKKQVKVPEKDWIRVENTHEPIIDIETWNSIQIRFKQREKPSRKTGEIQMFSKKVYCADCGRIFTKNTGTTTKGDKIHYLECKSRKYGSINCKNTKAIRYDLLENLVLDEINKQLEKYYNSSKLQEHYKNSGSIKNTYQTQIETLEIEKKEIQGAINKKNSYYQKLYEDKVDEIITETEFRTFRSKYSIELEKLDNRVKTIENEIALLKQKQINVKTKTNIFKKYKHIDKLNKIIIDEFIDRILIGSIDPITNEREITIEWDFLKI